MYISAYDPLALSKLYSFTVADRFALVWLNPIWPGLFGGLAALGGGGGGGWLGGCP